MATAATLTAEERGSACALFSPLQKQTTRNAAGLQQPMPKKKKSGRGGPRPGAGVKPIGEEPMENRTIRVESRVWERWRAAAESQGLSLSEWLRSVADAAADDVLG